MKFTTLFISAAIAKIFLLWTMIAMQLINMEYHQYSIWVIFSTLVFVLHMVISYSLIRTLQNFDPNIKLIRTIIALMIGGFLHFVMTSLMNPLGISVQTPLNFFSVLGLINFIITVFFTIYCFEVKEQKIQLPFRIIGVTSLFIFVFGFISGPLFIQLGIPKALIYTSFINTLPTFAILYLLISINREKPNVDSEDSETGEMVA